MNIKRLTHKSASSALRVLWSLSFLLLTAGWIGAQTYPGSTINTAGNSSIPSTGTGGCTASPQTTGGTYFNNTVAGLAANAGVSSVLINLNHTWCSDLDLYLQAPNGQILELSTDNGGSLNNYNNTNFVTGSPNITTGTPPFTGNFAPEGTLTSSTCGTNITPTITSLEAFTPGQNGTWQLRIKDDVGGDTGNMIAWSITFSTVAAPCDLIQPVGIITAGNDPGICTATVTVPVPATTPTGCLGQEVGLRYRLGDTGPFTIVALPAASITLTGVTAGTHTLYWEAYNLSSGLTTSETSQEISVSDDEAPMVNCPSDIVVSLDPGACDAIVGYTVTATDNCPFAGPMGQVNTINTGGNGNASGGMVWFDINNLSGEDITVTELGMNISNATMVNVYRKAGPSAGFQTNPGAWTLVGSADATVGPFSGGFPGNGTITPAPTSFVVPPGLHGIALHMLTAASNYTNGNGLNQFYTDGTIELLLGSTANSAWGFPFNPRVFNGYVAYGTQSTAGEIVQTSGLPSGSVFPRGTTTNCFETTDIVGNIGTCCFDVIVNEYPTPSTTLACNDNVQVSVNENCEAYVTTDMILEGGPYGCYDDYMVEVEGFGSGFGGVTINSSAIGQTLTVTVTDPETGNSCWGTISVEDKIKPMIECRDQTIMCGAQLPDQPAPAVVGYQNLVITGLNDLLELNEYIYEFDFGYLPAGTPALDVDVRIQIDDHTWLPDIDIVVESPGGTQVDVFTLTGCFGQEWPINLVFDDEGQGNLTMCADLDAGPDERLQPVCAPGVSCMVLDAFDGEDASGVWTVTISDGVGGDDGHVREVGLYINVNLPQVDPSDNCGEVDLTYTDTESGDPCEGGLIVTRHWVATDESGNSSACDQVITVEPLVLDSVVCPPAYVGTCGDSDHPSNTGWPTVNGSEITDEDNICNIYVGYWDNPLNDCGNGVKIVRTWTVLDWCTQNTITCTQVIKLTDDQAPVLTCPSNFTVGTDFWYCYANVSVPKPEVNDACGSAYTLSLSSSAGVVVNFGNNYVINQLPIGTHTVTWTALDECGNSSSCSFSITVEDDVVPVANCDSHTTVSLTNDGPYGITLVPAHVFDDGSYDNCGPVSFRVRRMDSCIDFDWTTEGACIDDNPGGIPPVNSRDRGTVHRPCVPFACCDVAAGPIMVELEVEDLAGNKNYCMVEVTVQDKISPFIECPPDIIVSCDFWFNVEEGTFVDADGNANGNLDEDPLSPIFGNMYDAFQYNDDESVRQDIIINDPGNEDYSQPHFWGIEGWADDNCEVNLSVRVRVVDDCSGDDLPGNAPDGAVKMIERRFSASDGNPGIAPGVCTQRIWVVDYEPFYISDVNCNNGDSQDGVIWPCDVLLTTCPEDLGDTGEPTIFDDACSLVGVTYTDTRFDFVDGACFKILRRWAVIDWCQYNSQTGEGLWYYTQVIKVHDEEGPEFVEPCETVVLCVEDEGVSLPDNNQAFLGEEDPLSSSCSVHLNLSRVVHETCSDIVNYDVKIYPFNGTEYILIKPTTTAVVDSNNDATLTFDTRQSTIQDIRRNGLPYNSQFCGDYHRILWSVEDGCGNWSHCEYLFRLEDCKKPSPVCINGLSTVVMPVGGQVTVWAKDFNASSFDDCTPSAELLYSFSGDTYEPSFTYTCDNVPAFGVELSTQIWVADGGTDDNCNGLISWNERNTDYCTTTIVITDNAGVCDTSGGSILAGEVLTEDVQSVELVGVSLNAPGHVFPTYVTATNGQYNFSNLVLPSEFAVNAERNDNHRNGVSTLDLVKIQKHLLGIEAINSPYDLIAADADNSQKVSAFDLLELRKLILGLYTELPNNSSWRFVDKGFVFADATNPWPFEESINMSALSGNEMDKDFVAIKVGDVNNTVQANAQQILPRNGNGVVSLVAEERSVETGEMVSVEVRSSDFASIEGYQFTMEANGLEFRGVESGLVDMKDENMGVFGSTLTASWHKVGGVSATSTDVLFTLNFEAVAAGQLSEMLTVNSKVTEAEAYNTSSDIKDLKLTFRGSETGAAFALYQNEPNPFEDVTMIGYDLPVATDVTLSIFDITGKVILTREQKSVKGYNTIQISSKDIPSVGVLYYRLDANEYTATKKMIIIK